MGFQPEVGQELIVDDVIYRIAEHPAAPAIPYGQEGRQAIVYQLVAPDGGKRALKVFKARYSLPALVSLADKLDRFADLPGLSVCRRTVLSARRHGGLLRQHPDLTYAVLMPWIEGPTWLEVMLEKRELAPEQSLDLARSLAEVLAAMEEQGLAHCDLSGPNLLLPELGGVKGSLVALVDIEQLYGPGLERPELLPGGSPGYAHKTAPSGLWGSIADRFAGAVLLAEMLGWCDEHVRQAAWGEQYFAGEEMQEEAQRYPLLVDVLQGRWGEGVATLFRRAWQSEALTDCPAFGEWLMALPEEVGAVATLVGVDADEERAEPLELGWKVAGEEKPEPALPADVREQLARTRLLAEEDLTAGESDLPTFEAVLEDEDPAVREAAVHGLAYMGTDATTRRLARMVLEEDDMLSPVAAKSLSQCGEEGVAFLRKVIESEDVMARRAAVIGLAQVEARDLLEKAAREDEQWIVRSAASAALEELEERDKVSGVTPPPEIEHLPWLISWAAAQGEGVGLGDAARRMLWRALGEGDIPVRLAAAQVLAQIGRPDDVEPLRAALTDVDPTVASVTLAALSEIGRRYELRIE